LLLSGAVVRQILHVDLDAFFCSVEELLNPELKGKAFVVGGSPQGRGVVTSASYPARKFGIRSAMPMRRALRLLPDLIVVSSRHGQYGQYSRKVMTYLRSEAPVVEQISVDEAFLDVSDDPRGGERAAAEMQAAIQRQFGLPTSWGVAGNKLVAKIATEVGKPNGLIVVPHGSEAAFLAPLPVAMLWGIGPKSAQKLEALGITTVGDLASTASGRLKEKLGDRGTELAARALGRDERPVYEAHGRKSLSAERTFSQDISSEKELHRTLLHLSERVGSRLRKAGLAGSTVRIKLRWPDFSTISRQARLDQPTDQDREIYRAAIDLFSKSWRHGRSVRLLGVGLADLGPQLRQLELFDPSWQHDQRLLEAIDSIRDRYGVEALRRATTLRQSGSDERGDG
jgi:DNA polymerase-4